jgi:DNA-binding IscR family transcriptional regulator
MNVSTRFTVALHILTLLASSPGEALTSEYIAGSVNTNPVVVRRLLGWELATKPGKLTLRDVRRAVNEGSPFSMHSQLPNPRCPVGKNIQQVLGPVYDRAERIMEDNLSHTTILSLLRSVQRRSQG